jgi:hypothetical protein
LFCQEKQDICLCADKLANIGLSLNGLTWWNHIPLELQGDFVRNRLGMPYYRFS